MSRLAGLLRSRWVRVAFVVVAVVAAVAAVVTQWDDVLAATERASLPRVAAATVPGAVFLLCTMQAWRAVLTDLGSPLRARAAFSLFFVSQLGKYVPGGVWNFVAVAELGAALRISRRRSLGAMLVATLVSLTTGVSVGLAAIVLAGSDGPPPGWAWVMLPLLVAALLPPVLNRLLGWALRLTRRPPLEEPVTNAGIGRAVAWSVAGWVAVGAQVWLLATALGAPATGRVLVQCVGAYALAWVAGFVVVLAPAGVGAREVVLASLLPAGVTGGGAVLLVLLTRVLQTVLELVLALVGAWARRSAAVGAQGDADVR